MSIYFMIDNWLDWLSCTPIHLYMIYTKLGLCVCVCVCGSRPLVCFYSNTFSISAYLLRYIILILIIRSNKRRILRMTKEHMKQTHTHTHIQPSEWNEEVAEMKRHSSNLVIGLSGSASLASASIRCGCWWCFLIHFSHIGIWLPVVDSR